MSTQANDTAEFLPRRRPSQERSRRRFDDILRAARALLVEVGFESFTCVLMASGYLRVSLEPRWLRSERSERLETTLIDA